MIIASTILNLSGQAVMFVRYLENLLIVIDVENGCNKNRKFLTFRQVNELLFKKSNNGKVFSFVID